MCGSGVFVGPYQAVTARHVVRDSFRIDPDRADDLLGPKPPETYFNLPHSASVVQVLTGRGRQEAAIWGVTRTWDPVYTDICLLEVVPDGEVARRASDLMPAALFPRWTLLPPLVGTQVEMIGFPEASMSMRDGESSFHLPCMLQQAFVTEVYATERDRGMYPFPGFTVDQLVGHGFSGGAVFVDGELCGLVSGESFGQTYVASLWPLTLMEIDYPDMGALRSRVGVGEMFDRGLLKSRNWTDVKARARKGRRETGQLYAYLEDSKPSGA